MGEREWYVEAGGRVRPDDAGWYADAYEDMPGVDPVGPFATREEARVAGERERKANAEASNG